MDTRFLRNKMLKTIFVMLLILGGLAFTGVDISYAAGTTKSIKLNTVDDRWYEVNNISGLTASSVVTLTSDNPNAVGFSYTSVEGTVEVDSAVINGKEQELTKGKWTSGDIDLGIIARRAGNATVTISVNTGGKSDTHIYNVTVEGVKPTCKKLSKKTIRSCDTAEFTIANVSDYGTFTISSDKDKAFAIKTHELEKNHVVDKTNPVTISGADLANGGNRIIITPKKTGTITFHVAVQQDNHPFTVDYTLTVVKYVNPIKTFQIGGKNYAKKFNKKAKIGDGEGLTKKECKYTLGGKPYQLKLKKGYKLVKVIYRDVTDANNHTLKKNSTILPKRFWELHIEYKDKKGRKWRNSLWYGMGVFG